MEGITLVFIKKPCSGSRTQCSLKFKVQAILHAMVSGIEKLLFPPSFFVVQLSTRLWDHAHELLALDPKVIW